MESPTPERFVARQPILDGNRKTVAYELLFRSGEANSLPDGSSDAATAQIIHDSMLLFGLDRLVGEQIAYVNFTETMLLNETWRLLPPERVVIELLESVRPTPEIRSACQELRRSGYRLALDDFEYSEEWDPILDLAEIIKIDLRLTPKEQAVTLRSLAEKHRLTLLAEKVETHEEFELCHKAGFELFQGYFFCRPELQRTREMRAVKHLVLQFMQAIHQGELDLESIEQIIRQDTTLSYKLLRYLNSARFGLRHKVESIKQALNMLGERPLRKWGSLVALTELADDKAGELLKVSLIRARFAEVLGQEPGADQESELDLFLLGMFSVIDAMVDQEMESILAEIPIADAISQTLLGQETSLSGIFSLVTAYERGDWDAASRVTMGLGLDDSRVAELYADAIAWTGEILAEG
jgi:EAL and modified HD-GYP domain-containing signal transduction protein